jgi:hypothetical protein
VRRIAGKYSVISVVDWANSNNMHIKKYVKTEDDEKEDDQRESMEKPAKLKTVTWMLRGATKAMSVCGVLQKHLAGEMGKTREDAGVFKCFPLCKRCVILGDHRIVVVQFSLAIRKR